MPLRDDGRSRSVVPATARDDATATMAAPSGISVELEGGLDRQNRRIVRQKGDPRGDAVIVCATSAAGRPSRRSAEKVRTSLGRILTIRTAAHLVSRVSVMVREPSK